MDLLASMRVYVLSVEKGSLSAAATACGISATMAGKHLQALEQRLGMRLLNRTTRRQHLTHFGEDYYLRCKDILRLVAETDTQAQAQKLQLAPAGKLRISAPVTFGTEALMPVLSEYLDRYPEVSIDLALSDRVVDLAEEGFEAAIRIGPLPDSDLIAKSLAPYQQMICASPSYLAKRGRPNKPEDLSQHECLSFSTAALASWRFTGQDGSCRIPVSGRLQVNHGQALRVAAINGLGIVLQPAILLAADVKAGRLVQLFPEHELPSRPMSVVYLPDPYRSPKLRSFVNFIVERFS